MKCWQFSAPNKTIAAQLSDEYGFPPFLSLLLVTRGICTAEAIEAYRSAVEWHDPMLLPDMDKAVDRIRKALDEFESILIFGDYDADGVTATAMLYSYLGVCGANVRFALPRREEGYGLNRTIIEQAAQQGVKLIITVDNGISACDEIAYASELGIDTVVTDHHKPPEVLPHAVALVNPHCAGNKSPFVPLCGAGVAFKLIAALEDCDGTYLPEVLLDQFSDLAAIGTIGDIVPLQGENRMLVRMGLKRIAESDRVGLHKLLETAALLGRDNLSAGNLSFTLVPRINAMGRMHTSEQVVQLLLTDEDEEAMTVCGILEQANYERQQQEGAVTEAANEILRQDPRRLLERVLIVWGEDWHPGVLGIVASRITEKYGKPSVVISIKDGVATGSCRSINGFSIIDALTSCSEMLTRFGGHTLAAGFSLPVGQVEAFAHAINAYAAQIKTMPFPMLRIDCKLNPAGLSVAIVDELQEMEPFGAENPIPVFALLGMRLDAVQPVGGGKHLRLSLSRDGHAVQAMLFRTAPEQFPYGAGDRLDLAVTLDKSMYRGVAELSVVVRDYRPEDFDAEQHLRQKQNYEAFARGEAADCNSMLPNRTQIASVYRLFKAEEDRPRDMSYFCYRLQKEQIGYDRLTIALIALRQLGLIRVMRDGDTLRVRINPTTQKVLLDDAPILKRLKGELQG